MELVVYRNSSAPSLQADLHKPKTIPYCRISTPQADDPDSFLLAHRISQGGRKFFRVVVREKLSTKKTFRAASLLGVGVGCLLILAWAVDKSAGSASWLTGGIICAGTLPCGLIAWHCHRQGKQLIAEYQLNAEDLKPHRTDIPGTIKAGTPQPGQVNFTAAQFENEGIYYEQVLVPWLNQLLHSLSENKEIISTFQKLASQMLAKFPPFKEVGDYDWSRLNKILAGVCHTDNQVPLQSVNLPVDQVHAINQYLADLVSLFTVFKASPFGQVSIDKNVLNRLQKRERLPGEQPRMAFELERLPGQPRISSIAYKWKDNFSTDTPKTYPTAIRFSEQGSALFGHAVTLQYLKARVMRDRTLLGSVVLAYAIYRIWQMEPIVHRQVIYGRVFERTEDVRASLVAFPAMGLLGVVYLGCKDQLKIWKIQKQSPWATKTYPQWLSEIGLQRAKDYLHEQATLASIQPDAQHITHKGFEALRKWYRKQPLSNQIPFDKLADDQTKQTDLIELAKTLVKSVKASPFGFGLITNEQADALENQILKQ